MLNSLQTTWLTARGFEERDVERLVTWAAMDAPSFLNNRDVVGSSRAFAREAGDDYIALCYRGDERCRNDGRVFAGPVAVLSTFNGHAQCVYVDPDLRQDRALAADIQIALSLQNAARAPRLVAAA